MTMETSSPGSFPAPGLYGDANGGNVTFNGSDTVLGLIPSAGTYTLTANINVANLTNTVASTIKPNGFMPFISGTFSNAGSFNVNGNNASGTTGGASVSATGTLQCSAGGGGAGRTTTGAGNAGSGSGGRNVCGSAGGNGGTAGGANTGGTGNNTAAPTAIQGTTRSLAAMIRGRMMDGTSFNGSGGGGGGGLALNATGTGSTSGAGGGAALTMIIFCRRLNNTGTISANGGTGSNASVVGDGVGGGGGGGSGGFLGIVTDEIISLGTITVNGGTGGTGAGTGAANGSPGTKGLGLIFTPTGTTII